MRGISSTYSIQMRGLDARCASSAPREPLDEGGILDGSAGARDMETERVGLHDHLPPATGRSPSTAWKTFSNHQELRRLPGHTKYVVRPTRQRSRSGTA
jgi:hypothetical protein